MMRFFQVFILEATKGREARKGWRGMLARRFGANKEG